MAGHRRELKPGKHELVVYLGRDPVTKRKRYRSKTFNGGARAADKELARLVNEADNEKPSTEQSMSWLMDEYLRLLTDESRSKMTLSGYKGYIENWIKPHLGTIKIENLTAGDVRRLSSKLTKAKKSQSTIRQVHAIVRGALTFAVQNDWADRNVAALAGPPKLDPTTVVAATPAEAIALYQAAGQAGDVLPTTIALATYTGARLGELCALRWSNIDFEQMVIHFYSPKTHQTGDVPMPPTLSERLLERWEHQTERAEKVGCALVDDPYVLSLVSDGSTKPTSGRIGQKFAVVRDELGMPHLHLHSLRHGYVTQLLAAGVDPLTVSKLVRHRDMTMIGRVYGHGTPEAFQNASKQLEQVFNINSPEVVTTICKERIVSRDNKRPRPELATPTED